MGMRGGNDTALAVRSIGYEPLVRWDPEWSGGVFPGVAASWEVNDEGTEYTFYLREGMKWSDGVPFTSDDLVFWWEDVATNTELNPSPPAWMVALDGVGTVEAIDEFTVKFSFPSPNGLLLQNLATGANGLDLTTYPRHYAEQFHADYNPDGIETLMEEAGYNTWVDLFAAKLNDWENADFPTLNAWVIKSPLTPDTTQVIAERNPYYWKVDPEGNQYPYIDRVVFSVGGDVETLVLNALNGEIDMQDRHIATNQNKSVFFDNMEAGDYGFYEVIPSSANTVVIQLNWTHLDPVKREIFQNKDFRAGLSHAINRQEIIDLVFVGQGIPYQPGIRPESQFYSEELATQFTEYDPDLANEYLDRVLPDKDNDGFRLMPNGERMIIVMEVATARTDDIDVMEQVGQHWAEVGIDMRLATIDRSLLYENFNANLQDANTWYGDAGLETILDPRYLFPFFVNASKYAPAWALWYRDPNNPIAEEPPAIVRQQMDLYDQLKATADPDEQAELFNQIIDIAIDQFYVIGISLPGNGYGLMRNNFHNVPQEIPGAWFYPNPGPTNTFQYYISE